MFIFLRHVHFVLHLRCQLIFLLTPLLLLPLPLTVGTPASVCGYCMLLMAIYWCLEPIPIAVTACLPVFLFPMLGLLPLKTVVQNYMKDIIMMYFGSLILAIAMEGSNLHKRIAYRIVLLTGTSPLKLMLGFMLPTWFLSMWISNTATAAMMLPMVEAVLQQLQKANDKDTIDHLKDFPIMPVIVTVSELHVTDEANTNNNNSNINSVVQTELITQHKPRQIRMADNTILELDPEAAVKQQQNFDRMAKAFTLCVTFATNIGGIATLTGSGPNMILKGQVDDLWASHGLASPIDYPSWMVYGFPISIICGALLWLWMALFSGSLQSICCHKASNKSSEDSIKKLIESEYQKLGKISFAEWVIFLEFALLVCLWFTRDPEFMTGWATFFNDKFIGDAVPVLLIATSLFVIPVAWPKRDIYTPGMSLFGEPVQTVMNWPLLESKMPWGMLLLFGGGFALADATQQSGLALWLGSQLRVLDSLPSWLMLSLLCLIVSLLTQVTSNAAMCTLLMPIMASMAEGIGKNPLFLMFPVCVATSYAFMLPVSNPPNAIAYGFGRLKIIDMVKAGSVINVLSLMVVIFATFTWGNAYFNLDKLPWESPLFNTTSAVTNETWSLMEEQ